MDMRNDGASNDRREACASQVPGELIRAKLYPPLAGIASRNRVAFAMLFALVPLGGSAFSVIFGFLAIWALISEMLRRFPYRIEPADRPIVYSSLCFFLVITLTDLAARPLDDPAAYVAILARLPFLIPLVMVSRMRVTENERILGPVFFGAALGGALLLPIVLVEYLVLDHARVIAFAGNSGPLSIVALLTAGLAIMHLRAGQGKAANLLAVVGASSAALTVVLSGMRGAWPGLVLVLGLAAWARRDVIAGLWRSPRRLLRVARVAIAALLVAGATAVAVPAVFERVEGLQSDVAMLDTDPGASTSLNRRLEMYTAAETAFRQRPLFGWGESNMWAAVRPHLDTRVFGTFSYSHLHNIFLTIGIDAGLVGIIALLAVLAAPLVTALIYRREPGGRDRLAFAAILVFAFVVPGMTNIMFFHDILDAVWALCVSTLCATMPAGRRGECEARAR